MLCIIYCYFNAGGDCIRVACLAAGRRPFAAGIIDAMFRQKIFYIFACGFGRRCGLRSLFAGGETIKRYYIVLNVYITRFPPRRRCRLWTPYCLRQYGLLSPYCLRQYGLWASAFSAGETAARNTPSRPACLLRKCGRQLRDVLASLRACAQRARAKRPILFLIISIRRKRSLRRSLLSKATVSDKSSGYRFDFGQA